MHELYERTLTRGEYLDTQGYNIVEMWECDFNNLLKTDQTVKEYVQSLNIVDPLNPRDAFAGGRTKAATLLVRTEGTTDKIRYIDFTSLYPDINKNGVYPVGHIIILTDNLEQVDVCNYFGLVKCDVEPPCCLLHPVSPYRCNNKLMFPLCRN